MQTSITNGGGGTCAMCRCQVMEGGGDVLPTEMNHLTRKEAGENWRLGCQVKVKQDMQIHVEEEIFGIKKWDCEVIGNDNVTGDGAIVGVGVNPASL